MWPWGGPGGGSHANISEESRPLIVAREAAEAVLRHDVKDLDRDVDGVTTAGTGRRIIKTAFGALSTAILVACLFAARARGKVGELSWLAERSAALVTQPEHIFTTLDPHTSLLSFNPCTGSQTEFTVDALTSTCHSHPRRCQFCAFVARFDTTYRVSDVIYLKGPNYILSSKAILERSEYRGTLLQKILSTDPKDPATGDIAWPMVDSGRVARAELHYEALVNELRRMPCQAAGVHALVVHVRSGDNVFRKDAEMAFVDPEIAISQVKDYVANNPEIERIVLSTKLHFGVPPPDDPSFAENFQVVSDSHGLPRYRISDEALSKNWHLLASLYNAAVKLDKEVWFMSHDNVDLDMCLYARACHFVAAGFNGDEAEVALHHQGAGTSFSGLMHTLNDRLKQCS